MTYTITLNAIRAHDPCQDGWEELLRHLGKTVADDEPLDLLTVLDSNGLDDALWCLRALGPEHDNAVRLLSCDLAEPAMRFVPPGENRPQEALRVARAYVRGEATAHDLVAAWAAARDATWVAARAAAGDEGAAGAAARAEQERIFRAWLAGGEG